MSRKKSPGTERFRNKEIQIKQVNGEWVGKHILIWEQANGKLPEGCKIMFADKNRLNFNLNNLVVITARECFYMNRHNLQTNNAELTKAGLALARHSIALADKLKKIHGEKKTGHYTIKRRAGLLGLGL